MCPFVGSQDSKVIDILDHTIYQPRIFIGKGRSTFTEYRGNFNVSQQRRKNFQRWLAAFSFQITDFPVEKLSLPYFEVDTTDTTCNFVTFRNLGIQGQPGMSSNRASAS